MRHMRRIQIGSSSIVGLLVGLGLTAVSLLLVLNKQTVLDAVSYYQYQPSSEVSAIAKRTTMNDMGKFYFFASQPSVETAQTFRQKCTVQEVGSAILGCYANNRIYVYDVTDAQLDGIKEVTAAHETLHAVYQRLSDAERTRIDKLIESEYAKHQNDKSLTDRMGFYARNEVGERDNELHSILGTEYSDLSPELEAHYAKYFKNRQVVVDMHVKYAAIFTDLKQKADDLSTQLQDLGTKIKTESAGYNTTVKKLNEDIEAFNSRASSGGFTSRAQFDAQRAQLVARAAALDASKATITADLSKYESLRQQYNDTAAASNKLYKSMDSNLSPTPSV